jgi:hypothetical protein
LPRAAEQGGASDPTTTRGLRRCGRCGQPVDSEYPKAKYCSNACRQRAYRGRLRQKAKPGDLGFCFNVPFYAPKYVKYWFVQCQNPFCNKTFKAKRRGARYCPKRCRQKAWRERHR